LILKAKVELYIDQIGDFDENKTSALECNSNPSLVDANYTWFKDNQLANFTYLNVNVTRNRITFLNAIHQIIDGEYSCKIYFESVDQEISSTPKALNVNRKFFNFNLVFTVHLQALVRSKQNKSYTALIFYSRFYNINPRPLFTEKNIIL